MAPQEDIELKEAQQEQPEQQSAEAATDPRDEAMKRLQSERDALFDRVARQQAEFENYRKRAEKEKSDFKEFAVAESLKGLLPIIDNFDLALKSQNATEGDFRKGVELIRKQMEDFLTKLGVQPVKSVGEHFDPHLHEAIEMVETDEAEDNTVLQELQRGYRFKERLLRPAMVRVARNPKH
jgi:molecular chaperone GrpE